MVIWRDPSAWRATACCRWTSWTLAAGKFTDAQQSADLFWACRGGGGGSFGIATNYVVKLQKVESVLVFKVPWPPLSVASAAAAMKAWQGRAPHAPQTIDSNLVIAKGSNGTVDMHAAGQSVGTLRELQRELKALPVSQSLFIKQMSFISAVQYFSGLPGYPTQIMKGKSDYATIPLSNDGLAAPMNGIIRTSGMYVVCDAYGGAMAKVAPEATAFAHRDGTLFCLQYGSVWASAGDTQERLNEMRQFYASMRPYVSGGAYVSYCDTDLADWPTAYWGNNLARLKQIKSAFDPDNVFRTHRASLWHSVAETYDAVQLHHATKAVCLQCKAPIGRNLV
jgi:hypothetical protein